MMPSSGRRRARRLVGPLLGVALLAGCQAGSDVERARALQAAGDFEASLEPLRRGIDAEPDDAELLYLYGLALVRTGRLAQAPWALREAMADPRWLAPAGLQLAAAALVSGNHELALAATDRILEAEPDDAAALALRARARIDSRVDYQGALADAERLLALDPDHPEALSLRLVALLGLERVEEAGAAIEDLHSRQGEETLNVETAARLCAARAIFAKEKGETETAGERFGECLQSYPAQPIVVTAALEYYDETGDRERSIEVLRAVLEEVPEALPYRVALAARLRRAGRNDEAEQLLREATELHPTVPEAAWVELSSHYLALERYADMAVALERAMEVTKDPSAALQFALADALILAERYEEALELAGRMSLPAHRHLVQGRVALEQHRPGEALEELAEGLRLWPDNAGARYYAARAAERVGDLDRAIEEYRYSIRIDPDATDARYRLALLHEAEGKPRLAIEAALSGGNAGGDAEAQLVALRAAVRSDLRGSLRRVMRALQRRPGIAPRVALAIAEGTADRAGTAAAATWLLESSGLDLRSAEHPALLRALVVYAAAAGESQQGGRLESRPTRSESKASEGQSPSASGQRARGLAERAADALEAALAGAPDSADLHEIHGLLLEEEGAPPAEIRAAYARALELDPDHARALLGLARLEAAGGAPEAALALQARAAEADQETAEPLRARAELLLARGRSGEAAAELEKLLDAHPLDAEATAALARLYEDRGQADGRSRELERRAERLGVDRALPEGTARN